MTPNQKKKNKKRIFISGFGGWLSTNVLRLGKKNVERDKNEGVKGYKQITGNEYQLKTQ